MTDKVQLIKEEIERQIEKGKVKCQQSQENNDHESLVAWSEHVATCGKLLVFINSIPEEPASEDLEEAASEYVREDFHERSRADFKAGAEWQKQQMKEAFQTEYEKGRFDMKEEMMKALIGDEIVKDIHNQLSVKSEPLNDTFGKFGDKVKIIIVKTEQ